tara:strand:- start:10820 stop:11011 length:192 start_codon:yes stop_codon:yes gene_type:complete
MIILYIIAGAILLFGAIEIIAYIDHAIYQIRNPYSKLLEEIEARERESGRSIQRDDQGTDRER